MAKKRLNIGLITSGFYDDYSNSVCRGISAAAEEFDCNLFIFPCRFIDYEAETDSVSLQCISKQYNTTAAYASEKNLDLIIISTGAIFKDPNSSLVKEFFASFGNVPIVSLAVKVEGYPYVMCDCTDGLTSVIKHLITAHSCRKFAYVAGPETHNDSNARLDLLKKLLKEHDIPFSDDDIVYTDFSEYCFKAVSHFLKERSFDFDAICCANDSTASAVYKVLQENGLTPGVDIIVTGYDNLNFSASCIPALTTVSADATDCAYRAAANGITALRSGKPIESLVLSTYPVFRESCCGPISITSKDNCCVNHAMAEMDTYVSRWITQYATHNDPSMPRFINDYSRSFLKLLFNELDDPATTELSINELMQLFGKFASSCTADTMAANTLSDFLHLAHHTAVQKVLSPHIEMQLHALFVALYRLLSGTINTINYALTAEARHSLQFAHNIAQHPISAASDMISTFEAIMEQLFELGISRSYMYISKQPREINGIDDIREFDRLDLIAYHKGETVSLCDKPLVVDSQGVISNKYISTDERTTMYVSPLFSAREQYGILVCEISYHHLSLFQTLISQINAEIETAHLFGRLQKQIDVTTTENQELSKIATRDALTSSYNRLGFFERAGSAIISPLNDGRHGFLVFSDLNCLKEINDTFGHEEGDFALCQVANVMRDCLGRAGIVGRIGGDEFVALMITDSPEYTCAFLQQLIKTQLAQMSDISGKPYHITVSLGVTDFICCEDLDLQSLIDKADQNQYLDKRNKPESINK